MASKKEDSANEEPSGFEFDIERARTSLKIYNHLLRRTVDKVSNNGEPLSRIERDKIFYKTLSIPTPEDVDPLDWWAFKRQFRADDVLYAAYKSDERAHFESNNLRDELRRRSDWFVREAPWCLPGRDWRWEGCPGTHYILYNGTPDQQKEIREEMARLVDEFSWNWKFVKDKDTGIEMRVKHTPVKPKDTWTKQFAKGNEQMLHSVLQQTVDVAGARPVMVTINPRANARNTTPEDVVDELLHIPRDLYYAEKALQRVSGCIRYAIVVELHPPEGLGKPVRSKPGPGDEGGPPVQHRDAGLAAEQSGEQVNASAPATVDVSSGYAQKSKAKRKQSEQKARLRKATKDVDVELLRDPNAEEHLARHPDKAAIVAERNRQLMVQNKVLKAALAGSKDFQERASVGRTAAEVAVETQLIRRALFAESAADSEKTSIDAVKKLEAALQRAERQQPPAEAAAAAQPKKVQFVIESGKDEAPKKQRKKRKEADGAPAWQKGLVPQQVIGPSGFPLKMVRREWKKTESVKLPDDEKVRAAWSARQKDIEREKEWGKYGKQARTKKKARMNPATQCDGGGDSSSSSSSEAEEEEDSTPKEEEGLGEEDYVANKKEIEEEERRQHKAAQNIRSDEERSEDSSSASKVSNLVASEEEEEAAEGGIETHLRVAAEEDAEEDAQLQELAQEYEAKNPKKKAKKDDLDIIPEESAYEKREKALLNLDEFVRALPPPQPQPPPPPRPEPPIAQAAPPQEAAIVHTLANLPHLHIVLWITEACSIDWTDANQLQRLVAPYFDDAKVSPLHGRYIGAYMGAERYWQIACDCNLLGDLLWATNAQATAAGPPSHYNNGRNPERNPWRRFRQAFEHLIESAVVSIPNYVAIYENYLYHLRTVADGRSGFPSLSDRYDRAQASEIGPAIGELLGKEVLFNMKFDWVLNDRQLKLWDSPTGKVRLMERRRYTDDSGIECRMMHSYAPVTFKGTKKVVEGLANIKAWLMNLNIGFADKMFKNGSKAGWDKEENFKSQVMHGMCPSRVLRLDYHWVEGPTWYYYVLADPNAPNEEREKWVEQAIPDKDMRDAAYAAGNKRNLPAWFPLPGSWFDNPRLPSLTVLSAPGTERPIDDEIKPRILMNGFLYKNTEYLDHVSGKIRTIDDLIKEQLGGSECGFCDPRLESFNALTGACNFDHEYTEEGDRSARLPNYWSQVSNFYGQNPCKQHSWKRCVGHPSGENNMWTCRYKTCVRHLREAAVRGEGEYNEPHEQSLRTWGPYFWRYDFMDGLRNCILPSDYFHKQKAVALIGERNSGKSTLTRPFGAEGRIFLHEEVMVPGDGTKADILAGLHENVKIFHGAEFKPKKTFPDEAVLKKFLEGGKISARGMRVNSSYRECDFPKIFDMNFEYATITHKDPQTGEMIKEHRPVPGWNAGEDDGNPFGKNYDPSEAMRERITVAITHHRIGGASGDVIKIVEHESMDVFFFLAELRYVPIEERSTWRRRLGE